jgi:uncharacterized protein (DUF697 family)
MIVRVNGVFGAKLSPEELDGTIGNDLVGVHVGLSAASGLEDDEREVVDEFARNDLQRIG